MKFIKKPKKMRKSDLWQSKELNYVSQVPSFSFLVLLQIKFDYPHIKYDIQKLVIK